MQHIFLVIFCIIFAVFIFTNYVQSKVEITPNCRLKSNPKTRFISIVYNNTIIKHEICDQLTLSGPNTIGIYLVSKVTNTKLRDIIAEFREAFGYPPAYITGHVSTENKDIIPIRYFIN